MFLFVLVEAPESHAIKPVRCYGRIQFRPCDEDDLNKALQEGRIRTSMYNSDPKQIPFEGKQYAEVTDTKFSVLSKDRKTSSLTGLWSGIIRGNGIIKTELVIFRDGAIESRISSGSVTLRNKATPFRITSAIPLKKGWNWRIEAYPLQ